MTARGGRPPVVAIVIHPTPEPGERLATVRPTKARRMTIADVLRERRTLHLIEGCGDLGWYRYRLEAEPGTTVPTSRGGRQRSREVAFCEQVRVPVVRGHLRVDHVPSDLDSSSWGGQDLNLRPTDYESAALTY